jgi:ribosomal protein L11 methyltransferase
MYEYKYVYLTEKSIEILEDMGIYPIEQEFKGEGRSFIVYYDETLPEIIDDVYESRTLVEDTGWEEKWKEYIKPGQLTDTIRYEFDQSIASDENTILIYPSMAFGTGTHPTTKCAARLLENVVRGKTVADVGCGSGILAITASKRGASKVYAFDIDPVALNNTAENIRLNNCSNISAWAGTMDSLSVNVDVVVANIITSVLSEIHPDVYRMRPQYIVYSGILASEYDEFLASLELEGYETAASESIEEWRGVLFRCL